MKFKNIIYLILFYITLNPIYSFVIYNENSKLDIKTNLLSKINRSNIVNMSYSYPVINSNLLLETNILSDFIGYGILNLDFNLNNDIMYLVKYKKFLIGFKNEIIGSIDYGNNYNAIFNINKFTQINPIIFSKYRSIDYKFLLLNNILTYSNKNLFGLLKGLDITLQKQCKDFNFRSNSLINLLISPESEGYNGFINYNYNDFIDIATAYSISRKKDDNIYMESLSDDQNKEVIESFLLGFRINSKKLCISSICGYTSNTSPYDKYLIKLRNQIDESYKSDRNNAYYEFSNLSRNIELLIQYKFNINLIPSIGYFQCKSYKDGTNNINLDRYIKLGFDYKLNEYTKTFADYKLNLVKIFKYISNGEYSSLYKKNNFNIGINYNF